MKQTPINIIIGMEESQAICIQMRKKGHNAFSCDLQPCSGSHPEWHIQQNVFTVLDGGIFITEAGTTAIIDKWNFGIFHPVCTHLTVSNNNAHAHGCSLYTKKEAVILRQNAIIDFMKFVDCNIPQWAIENPIGIMSTEYRKPNQIIQPYNYGHGETKATCLWLKGIPRLNGCNQVEGRENKIWKMPPSEDRAKLRSKTYTGIAEAMAAQWPIYIKQ